MKRAFRRPGFILMGAVVALAAFTSGRTTTPPSAGVVERQAAATNTAGTTSSTDGRHTQGHDPRQAVSAVVRHLNTMTFAPGQQAGFIGIYSHTEPSFDLDDQFTSTEWGSGINHTDIVTL
jgi:hypothetical protein